MVQYTQYYKYNILSDFKNNTYSDKQWQITIIAIVNFLNLNISLLYYLICTFLNAIKQSRNQLHS